MTLNKHITQQTQIYIHIVFDQQVCLIMECKRYYYEKYSRILQRYNIINYNEI